MRKCFLYRSGCPLDTYKTIILHVKHEIATTTPPSRAANLTYLRKDIQHDKEARRCGFAHLFRGKLLALEAHREAGLPLGRREERRQHGVDDGGNVVGADVVQLCEKDVLQLLRRFVHDHAGVNGLQQEE